MKKTLPIFFVVVIVIVSLTGCQATPDKPVVIQKDLEQMIEKGMEQSETASPTPETELSYAELCSHYGVPERFQTTVTEGKLVINCDVKIELPDTMALPMARVKAGGFTQEQVYKFWDALVGDTEMYHTAEQPDKEYWQQQILEKQAELAAETDEGMAEFLELLINDFKELYQSAPEHNELITSDGTFQASEMNEVGIDESLGTFESIHATAAPYQDNAMMFYVRNDVKNYNGAVYSGTDEQGNIHTLAPRSCASLSFTKEGLSSDYSHYWQGKVISNVTDLLRTDDTTDNCKLTVTPQQAMETVKQLLMDMEVEDMMIDAAFLCSSNAKNMTDLGVYEGDYQDGDPGQQAYVFRMLRKVDGVKVESTHGMSQTSVEMAVGEEKMAVGKEWAYEYMLIAVDDEGVCSFNWYAPLEITEHLTDNTTMKPWGDIQNIFEKMLMVQNATYENIESYKSVSFDITHVSLSLQRIMERDSYTTGLIVPVWNFYGTTTFTEQDGRIMKFDSFYKPLISINAIDGSVIDVDSGY